MRGVPIYHVYDSHEREIYRSAKETDVLLEYIDSFVHVEAVPDVNIRTVFLHLSHALWQLRCPHQLFPFDPGGCLVADSLEHGLSFKVTRHKSSLSAPPRHSDSAKQEALLALESGHALVLP